jgi:sarcosine oxidase
MTPQFQYAIVGRGLTGAAAARHLAEQVGGVVLIGPDEPVDRASHDGVFASHYDEGRITRTIDPDETWARFANRSIARYRDIETRSGIGFYAERGCLIWRSASPISGFLPDRTPCSSPPVPAMSAPATSLPRRRG